MPVKNIIPGQRVVKEKLQRATPALAGGAREELQREMTPAEMLLWREVRANKLGVRFGNDEIVKSLSSVMGKIKAGISE